MGGVLIIARIIWRRHKSVSEPVGKIYPGNLAGRLGYQTDAVGQAGQKRASFEILARALEFFAVTDIQGDNYAGALQISVFASSSRTKS